MIPTTPTTVSTWYGELPAEILQRAANVKLLVCDVDGVFSDGQLYMGSNGEELKSFHTRDGYGVKALLNAGIEVAVITGRRSVMVEQRMQALGVKEIHQGQEQKESVVSELLMRREFQREQCAAIGDDIPDLGMFAQAHLAVAVNDAHPYVQQQAHYTTSCRGGFGAVRELADLILLAQGKLPISGGVSL